MEGVLNVGVSPLMHFLEARHLMSDERHNRAKKAKSGNAAYTWESAMSEAKQQSVFYVIERMDGASRLYMASHTCGWTHDIRLAAKWEVRRSAEDVWRRQPCHFRGVSAVAERAMSLEELESADR
jgi:hypothetical protein